MTSQGIRLTNMLFNHGPGSILETIQGPVVVMGWGEMIASIHQNNDSRSMSEWRNYLQVNEPRLSSQLLSDNQKGEVKLHKIPSNESVDINSNRAIVQTVDFPTFNLCRQGEGHHDYSVLYEEFNEKTRCPICKLKARSSPIRFVQACNAGHLDDLPWYSMIHESQGCSSKAYRWVEKGSSTRGITITCVECGASKKLNEAQNKISNFKCKGNDPSGVMPEIENCDRSVNLVLRSSTSVWQSESVTTITIPDDEIDICLQVMKKLVFPRDFDIKNQLLKYKCIKKNDVGDELETLETDFGIETRTSYEFARESYWRKDNDESWKLVNYLNEFRGYNNLTKFNRFILPVLEKINSGKIEVSTFIQRWQAENNPVRVTAIEAIEAEYNSLFSNDNMITWPDSSPLFVRKAREEDDFGNLMKYTIGNSEKAVHLKSSRVTKLRTVTALSGFKRLVRDSNGNEPDLVKLSHRDDNNNEWYAAVESQGEGILISMEDGFNLYTGGRRWNAWEDKFNQYLHAFENKSRKLFRGLRTEPSDVEVNSKHIAESHPCFVWWHTFAHQLIRIIQQDTGYSSSSIKERIYCENIDGIWKGGILLYVTEGGMDGTLGGLTSLVPNLQRYIDQLAEKSAICSNDPLCSDNPSSSLEEDRACYSCSYNSETSCAHRNLFLDRLLLRECVGL